MLTILGLATLALCPQAAPPRPLDPDAPVLWLDEIGNYAAGYAYRGQPERRFPDGWSGHFEEQTGVALLPTGEVEGKSAFLLHCPWRGGTGIAFQEFAFRMPKARRVLLRGATAMRSDVVDNKSDGVTFRVKANGKTLLDVHRADAKWQPFEFDLTASAGPLLTLRFETDPGPRNNASWDYSLWGGRELILEGFEPRMVARPSPPPLILSKLWPAQNGNVAPPSGFEGTLAKEIKDDVATFRYRGAEGTLEYRWRRPQAPEDPLFGKLSLRARMKDDAEVEIPLATTAHLVWSEPAQPLESRWEDAADGIACVRTFKAGDTTATVRLVGRMLGKSLVLDVSCDRPLVKTLEAGAWGPAMRRRRIPVLYYSGQVDYLPSENLFASLFLDWTSSSASSHDNTRAHYGALTDGKRNLLRERVVGAAAWHLAETLPNIPNPPSPHIAKVGDRIVLDIWGGRYEEIAGNFEKLHEHGVRNAIALIHDWQRSGYDNALPMHFPAQAGLGGDAGMKVLVSTGARLGYLVALHENYVDYYPNYDHFDEKDIPLDSRGQRVPAWYNPGTKIQSFAVKPNAILRLAGTQSPEIHLRYGTNAVFLDVHSSVPPWFHVDFRAGEEGAGTFRRVWDVHRELWDYQRKTHGGPVFGEGNNHWYWSGYLDGAEAQFGQAWPTEQGMSAPLMVDFDLLKVHPLQVNHGMGYYERWWAKAEWGHVPPMVVMDQYRMQEVAFGHAGFRGGAAWSDPRMAWLEHHLLTPAMARYATAKPVEIQYDAGGRWVDGTAAAKLGRWPAVRARYDNGLEVTANTGEAPVRAGEHLLPRFGWLAKGAGVTAWTAERDGGIADFAETPESVFANARNAAHWNVAGLRRVRPEVGEFAAAGPRAFRVTYRWKADEALPQDYVCFVHFSRPGADEGIRFQQDHGLAAPTSQWARGSVVADGPHAVRVPDDVADGDYEWAIGLYAPGGGGRAPLEGVDDGKGRIRLGVLRVKDGGKTVSFEPERGRGEERLKWYRLHVNESGKAVDFGPVKTNGSVLVRREGEDWVLRAMPREGGFEVELSAERFGRPAEVRGDGAAVAPEPRGDRWKLPLNGAKTYRWKGR
jgi:hypothetical protein